MGHRVLHRPVYKIGLLQQIASGLNTAQISLAKLVSCAAITRVDARRSPSQCSWYGAAGRVYTPIFEAVRTHQNASQQTCLRQLGHYKKPCLCRIIRDQRLTCNRDAPPETRIVLLGSHRNARLVTWRRTRDELAP